MYKQAFQSHLCSPKRCLKYFQIHLIKLFLPNWLICHTHTKKKKKNNIWTHSTFRHVMYVTLHTSMIVLGDRSFIWYIFDVLVTIDHDKLRPPTHGEFFRQSMAWNQVFSACLHFVISRVKLQHLFEHPHALPIASDMWFLRCFLMQ